MGSFDLIVIGGGPGGYSAAVTAAKSGRKVALVEERELGGTCLNRGCIPSKTMLKYAEVLKIMEKAKAWGIEAGSLRISFDKMKANKDDVIRSLRSGVENMMKANKIKVFHGRGTLIDHKKVRVDRADYEVNFLTADKIIFATGSKPFVPPIPGADHPHVHTSDTIFDLSAIPETMVIVGGGIIGVECAAIYSAIGSKVTIVEMQDRILSTEDADVSKTFSAIMKREGVDVFTEHQAVEINETDVVVTSKDGKEFAVSADAVLVCAGRKPNIPTADHMDLKMNGAFIEVNERMETSLKGLYAIGDLIDGYQLAHVAEREGEVAAKNAI
ncbi:MAG TPA: FAD-dependent oxidoreductase, partial [Bacillales bacterium]|nr:FAD-dependent oxidoreductase [Bacillales bacterium]